MKIDVTKINIAIDAALKASQLEDVDAQRVKTNYLRALREMIEAENAETETDGDETKERQKSQYIIVVSDPKGLITEDLTGWVLQIPEEDSIGGVKDNIHKALYDFNASKKGRLQPAKAIGEGFEFASRKFFTEYGIKVKTKNAVFVVATDNILPKDNSNKVG